MSDYLRGLVTRVLAPQRILQPRPAMAYESPAVAAAAIGPSTSYEPRTASAISRATKTAHASGAPSPALPEVSQETIESRTTFEVAPPSVITERFRRSEAPDNPAPRREADIDFVSPAATPARADPTPILERAEFAELPVFAPIPRPLMAQRLLSPARPRRDRVRDAAPPSVGAAAPIEITIGRIDVRAVLPPAAAPPARKAKAPVMSLDDYLASRGGRE